jgi:hypothetical protein
LKLSAADENRPLLVGGNVALKALAGGVAAVVELCLNLSRLSKSVERVDAAAPSGCGVFMTDVLGL